MTEIEYNQKFRNAKSPVEIDELNKQFSKSIHKKVILNKIKKYLLDNLLILLDLIIGIIALVISIIK